MQSHESLIQQIARGDKSALSALYRALEKPVYRFILSRLNDPFESSDILHDVFIEVWRSASKFEGKSKVQTWIFGIAYRKVIDRHRKAGRTQLTDETPEMVDETDSAETCLVASQDAANVRHCVDQLSEDHRSAIALAFWEDMSYRAIAEVCQTAEGTIKTRIFHAKKLLMRCLSSLVPEGSS